MCTPERASNTTIRPRRASPRLKLLAVERERDQLLEQRSRNVAKRASELSQAKRLECVRVLCLSPPCTRSIKELVSRSRVVRTPARK